MDDLVRACNAAAGSGADFPMVWHEILKTHRLVAGVPIQRLEETRPMLEVPLITGHRIVYDSGRNEFSVTFGRSPGAPI